MGEGANVGIGHQGVGGIVPLPARTGDPSASLVRLIDAEIASADSEGPADVGHSVKGDAATEALYEKASHWLSSSAIDPTREDAHMRELVDFALADGKVDGPLELMAFLTRLERGSPIGTKHPFLERAWHSMRALQVQRGLADLQRGG